MTQICDKVLDGYVQVKSKQTYLQRCLLRVTLSLGFEQWLGWGKVTNGTIIGVLIKGYIESWYDPEY